MEERMAQWGILPSVDGAWLVDEEALEAYAQDFGKVISERPALVLRPGSVKDVQCAMRFAAREGLCVAARGDAHSAGGQMQMKDGLVIDMTAISEVYRLGPDSIHVGAGISWRRLVETTLEQNLTPPVLTDWLDVTVGGTLSMGGLGFSSYWDGTQMDHILELEVVTGDGAVHRVSPSHQPQLFDAVRGTHGQIALIVGVTLPLRRAPTHMQVTQAVYAQSTKLLEDLKAALKTPGYLVHALAAANGYDAITTRLNSEERLNLDEDSVRRLCADSETRWIYQLEIARPVYAAETQNDDVELLPLPRRWMDSRMLACAVSRLRVSDPTTYLGGSQVGRCSASRANSLVPGAVTDALIVDAFATLDPHDDIGGGPVLLLGLYQSKVSAPYYALPHASDLSIFFGLLRRAEPATSERVDALRRDNERRYAEALEHGAGRYVCDTPPSLEDEADLFWPQHYGELWPTLCALKRRHDPSGLFSRLGAALQRGEQSNERVP